MAFKNWNLSSVTASTDTTLVQPTGSARQVAVCRDLVIKNNSGSTASVVVKVTDSSDNLKAYLFEGDVQDDERVDISEVIILNHEDKLVVNSDQANTSFFISGDQSDDPWNWYVRPSGGSYGDEDGTSYDNAWDGFSHITWGSGGVLAGDTLYVDGTHYDAYLSVHVSGTAANYVNITSYNTSNLAEFNGGKEITAWDGHSGNVYYVHITEKPCIVYNDDTEMVLLKSSDATCSDGDYYYDTSTGNLYVKNGADYTIYYNTRHQLLYIGNYEYIKISNLKFKNGNAAIYYASDTADINNLLIDNCTIDTFLYGIYCRVGGGNTSSNHAVTNSTLVDCCQGMIFGSRTSNTEVTENLTITGNSVLYVGGVNNGQDDFLDASYYSADKEGMGLQNIDTGYVLNNTLSGCSDTAAGIVSWHHANADTDTLIIGNNTVSNFGGQGVSIGGSSGGSGYHRDIKVYENIILNCEDGIRLSQTSDSYNYVVNNVFSGCNYSIRPYDNFDNFLVKNNISINPDTHHVYVKTAINTSEIDYNDYYPDSSAAFNNAGTTYTFADWKTATSQDAHSITSDPSLDSSYRLQEGSPCIDAGTTVSGVTDGYYGSAPDIGAYESNF
jgi:hypothetical protein